jgi:hypothetical protein
MTHSHTHTLPRVFIGATYQSRTGSEYRIVALDRKGRLHCRTDQDQEDRQDLLLPPPQGVSSS